MALAKQYDEEAKNGGRTWGCQPKKKKAETRLGYNLYKCLHMENDLNLFIVIPEGRRGTIRNKLWEGT